VLCFSAHVELISASPTTAFVCIPSAHTTRELERAGAAAFHIEDQIAQKRCGHRPDKQLVSVEEMCDRIAACVDARQDPATVVMARTDAFSVEGLDAAMRRAEAYQNAGADMLFCEAFTELDHYKTMHAAVCIAIDVKRRNSWQRRFVDESSH
jgi:2-methylisocitrate lyase-like PEP mutase family enzyme